MPRFQFCLATALSVLSLLGGTATSAGATLNAAQQQQAGAVASPLRVGIGLFEGNPELATLINDILAQDLRRGAVVSVIDTKGIRLGADTRPDWANWQALDAGTLVGGSVSQNADGTFSVRVRLWAVDGYREIAGTAWSASAPDIRRVAHAIADFIQEKLSGTPGQYSERRVSVSRVLSRYVMSVTDSDGADARDALSSPRPILMPTWLSDRKFIAYVSLETFNPLVWMHEVRTGRRMPAGAAAYLVSECPAASRFLATPLELNMPPEWLDDAWEKVGGLACKDALSSLALKVQADFVQQRPGMRTAISPRLQNERTYPERIVQAVRRKIDFDTSSLTVNPEVVIQVQMSSEGQVTGSSVHQSSGLAAWDDAALDAVRRTPRMPSDADGSHPPAVLLRIRPLL